MTFCYDNDLNMFPFFPPSSSTLSSLLLPPPPPHSSPLSHTPPNPLILQLVVRLHCRSTRSGDKWANLLQTSAGERVLYCEQSKSWFDPLKSKPHSWFKTHGRFLQNEMCKVLICRWCDFLLTWRIVEKFLCATSYLFSFLFKKKQNKNDAWLREFPCTVGFCLSRCICTWMTPLQLFADDFLFFLFSS